MYVANINNAVLNTLVASGGDITLLARMLNVNVTPTNGSGTFPTMSYPQISGVSIQPSLVEAVNSMAFTFTAADNTTYSFTIIQDINGTMTQVTIQLLNSGTGATNASISAALIAKFVGAGLNVTATASSNVVTVVGIAGYPLFTGLSGTNVVATSSMLHLTGVTDDYDGTPTLFTKTSHGLVVGNVIQFVSGTGDTALVAGTQYRVETIPSSSTFTLQSLVTGIQFVGATADLAAGVFNLVPEISKGQGATMYAGNADYVAGILGAVAGNQYSAYTFTYGFKTPGSSNDVATSYNNQFTLYVNEGTASTSPSTNFGTFDLLMRNYLSGHNSGAVTAIPDAFAVADND